MRLFNAFDIPRLREEVLDTLPFPEKGMSIIDLRGKKGILRE